MLIVEDAEPCAATLEIALAQIPGVEVRLATTATEARQAMVAGEFCALITDIQLPDESGLELIVWVRAHDRGARLPVIVISGISDPDAPAASLARGADAYFVKPFSPAAVRRKVEELIHA